MRLKDKAIAVIEALSLEDNYTAGDTLMRIYKFSHIARGKCENPHKDWVGELDKTWDAINASQK